MQAAMRLRPQAEDWHSLVPGLAATRRRATFARWRHGAAAWRKWADTVHALQADLAPDPEAARLLTWLVFSDFSRQAFVETADFNGADFPSGASFEGAKFFAEAWFCGASFAGLARFGEAMFLHDALFETCWFGAGADFTAARFVGSVRLSASVAAAGLLAPHALFERDIWARGSRFLGPVVFAKSRIAGEAGWGGCTFAEGCDFSYAQFSDNAGFETSIFSGEACFEHTVFSGNARFTGARFDVQPRFRAARFLRAGHFDDSQLPVTASPVLAYRAEIERRLQSIEPHLCD